MARRRVFAGVGASPGIAIGRVFLIDRRRVRYPKRRIRKSQIIDEISRFDEARKNSERQISDLSRRAQSSLDRLLADGRAEPPPASAKRPSLQQDHLSILEAHRIMLHDPLLIEGTRLRIAKERLCAEWALRQTLRDIKGLLDDLEDDYFRERRSDIEFVGDRILRNLTGMATDLDAVVPEGSVVVAHDLGPADTLQMMRQNLAGFVTDVGGRTSHTAILARAMQVPAVVAAGDISDVAGQNDIIALDGTTGEVVLHPGRSVVAQYRGIARQRAEVDEQLHEELQLPAVTRCGTRIAIHGNIEGSGEIELLLGHGADGVGLLRTEFLFMGGDRPDIDAHREAYVDALEKLQGRPLTVRTFDLGGDKFCPHNEVPTREGNPALGLRAIRYCLRDLDLFMSQLQGILAASAVGPVRLLFPMISGVAELREAKAALEEAKALLRARGVPYDEHLPVGVMIEIPSAVWVADHLARESDFFSVGTNDLIQYTLAADRANENVAYLYKPLHIAVLRALSHTAAAAHAARRPLAMCGEMAAEPLLTPVLLGLGFTELSMHGFAMPRIKHMVRNVSIAECQQLARDLICLTTPSEIEARLRAWAGDRFRPGLV